MQENYFDVCIFNKNDTFKIPLKFQLLIIENK